jgi:hypothetical protein
MLQPAVSACYGAGSTYGTLVASKHEGGTSFPASGNRRVFDVGVNPLSTPSRPSQSYGLRFVQCRQVYSAQAVALAPIEQAPCRDPAGMEGGMQ